MIYLLELEPLKERYTHWWSYYIPEQFDKLRVEQKIISGKNIDTPEVNKVTTGTVLDAGATNHWKSVQLQKISNMFINEEINDGDIFFVADIWFPGIEMIRYMSQMYQKKIKIWGVWHAGSTTMGDFAEPMHSWSKHFEIGFLNICDGVFVGSEYSKNSIVNRLLYSLTDQEIESISSRIHCYGMPLDYDYLQQFSKEEKENIILFPHRPDIEKNPHIWFSLIQGFSTYWDEFEKYRFIFCTSKDKYKSSSIWINAFLGSIKQLTNIEVHENLSKEQYYELLGKSKLMVSTTGEENFGYCAVEALAMGTKIAVPNAFSHPEIVEDDNSLMYRDYDELAELITKHLEIDGSYMSKQYREYAEPYSNVIRQWIRVMKS